MATPLSSIYMNQGMHHRPMNTPHAVHFIVDPETKLYWGMVKHGSASSTTLQKKFSTQEEALAHAQHFADALNEKPADDQQERNKAFADEIHHTILQHIARTKKNNP